MYKDSHILVGNLVWERLRKDYGICLDKAGFVMGNVIPDFSWYAFVHPHFIQFSLGYVQSEVEELANTWLDIDGAGRDCSHRLGILCHYCTDFFCHAHSRGYPQAVVNHLLYEHRLHEYFLRHFDKFRYLQLAAPAELCKSSVALNERLLERHALYEAEEPSYDTDLTYTLRMCAETAASLVRCACAQACPPPLEAYSGAAAV